MNWDGDDCENIVRIVSLGQSCLVNSRLVSDGTRDRDVAYLRPKYLMGWGGSEDMGVGGYRRG